MLFAVTKSSETGLLTSNSTLSLPLASRHFRSGHLVGKCVASMLTMHWQSPDLVIREESPTLLAASSFDGTKAKDAGDADAGEDGGNAGDEGTSGRKAKKKKKARRKKGYRSGECLLFVIVGTW